MASRTLQTTLRIQIEKFMRPTEIPEDQDPRDFIAENKMAKQKRCGICPVALDRKTYYKCLRCEKPMCKEHTAKICCDCCIHLSEQQ